MCFFLWGLCCSSLLVLVLYYYVSLCSEFRFVMFITMSAYKRCLYPQLFVGGRMPSLRYLCLLVHSGLQHILCFCFVCLRLVCPLCCQCLWIVHFWLPFRYYLTFLYSNHLTWLTATEYLCHRSSPICSGYHSHNPSLFPISRLFTSILNKSNPTRAIIGTWTVYPSGTPIRCLVCELFTILEHPSGI